MRIVERIPDVRAALSAEKEIGKNVGLAPTMGAFHEGHISLMRRARETCGFVVVSLFVNPTQFGPNEDLARYPRNFDADRRMAEDVGVDLLFAPSAEELYPEGFCTYIDPGELGNMFEGEIRPGHFRGVATVVAKLFNIVDPDMAFFGLKDYQQFLVIENLVRDLNMRVQIVPMPTVREEDGLAMSSRNVHLDPDERKAAAVLHRALNQAGKLHEKGEVNVAALEMAMREVLDSEPMAKVDYAVVRNADTLAPIYTISDRAVALAAVRIGNTRLIDNMLFG